MKHALLFFIFNVVLGSHATYAASASSTAHDEQIQDAQEPCFVGSIQISPFFSAIPNVPEPTKYCRPFSGTYPTDFENYKRDLQTYRAKARSSMEGSIAPAHALISRLARRTITIAVKNPEEPIGLIRDPSHLCDNRINCSWIGLSVKDSLADTSTQSKKIERITAEQCNELLGADCIKYLKEVKTPGTALRYALHGQGSPVKVGYFGYLDTEFLSTSRKSGTGILFTPVIRRDCVAGGEHEGAAISHAEIRAKQCAALLSIIRTCGEPVVEACKDNIVKEWLAAYLNENPCSWQLSSSELYPSMPILAHSIPNESCTVL